MEFSEEAEQFVLHVHAVCSWNESTIRVQPEDEGGWEETNGIEIPGSLAAPDFFHDHACAFADKTGAREVRYCE